MSGLLEDFRRSLRLFVKQPTFTLAALATLSLGIGANAALFSVFNAVLLRPLPYRDAERLVMVWDVNPSKDIAQRRVAPARFLALQGESRVLEELTAYQSATLNLTGTDRPESLQVVPVTSNFFSFLGAQPAMGRSFEPEETGGENDGVVLISYGLWQRRFGGRADIIGQGIELEGRAFDVVGVMPSGFDFPTGAQVWKPLGSILWEARYGSLYVLARLEPDGSLEQAQSEMDAIARRIEQEYPDSDTGWGITLVPLRDQMVGNLRQALQMLLGAVGFVLLIVCANIANLLLARDCGRKNEMAVRSALGAGRGRLVQQILAESTWLALAGGAGGLILAYWGSNALIALSPIELNLEESIRLDAAVLIFTLAVTLVTGFLFGLPSALSASRINLSEAFKQGGSRGTMGTGTSRLRGALVMAEVALALILLVGSALLAKSFIRILDVDTGFESEKVLTMRLDLPRSKYTRRHQMSAFVKDVLTRVENLPEVESAGVVNHIPLGGSDEAFRLWIAGRSYERHVDIPTAEIRSVGGEYFRAMGIPLLRGRLFTEMDESGGPGVALINQTMARRFFPDTDPLGKELGISGPDGDMLTVVGVVGDVKHFGLDTETRSELYVPYQQEPWPYLALIVRSTTEPLDLAPLVLEQVWAVDPDQPAHDIRTMQMRLSQSLAGRRFSMTLLSLFGGSALLLAVLGIYGVLAYSVAQRTREIGVRVALGAQSRDILNLVLRQGLILSLAGMALGLAGAFALTRTLSSLLFEVGATDPMTFTAVPLLLLVVVILACYIPARRAAKIDSIAALRYE